MKPIRLLKHHGVLGMHWGVINEDQKTGKSPSEASGSSSGASGSAVSSKQSIGDKQKYANKWREQRLLNTTTAEKRDPFFKKRVEAQYNILRARNPAESKKAKAEYSQFLKETKFKPVSARENYTEYMRQEKLIENGGPLRKASFAEVAATIMITGALGTVLINHLYKP